MRIAIGPVDPAGVGAALAQGLRERGHEVQVVHRIASRFGYPFDREIESRGELLRFAWFESPRFDVLHALGGGSWLAFSDLALTRLRGGTAITQYNGSDCRTLDIASRLHPARARIVDPAQDRMIRRQRWLGGLASTAAVVQDRELVDYVRATHRRIYVAPFAIDLRAIERAESGGKRPGGESVRVFHAPSNRRIKGTGSIERAVAEAAQEVPIEFVTLSDRPHPEVLAGIARSDVVIDQLHAETPGVFAAEAMALGKPVLGEHDPGKLASFARPCPVVPVAAENLSARLVELCRDPDRRRKLGEEGRRYARAVHAPQRAAGAAERIYAHAPGASPGIYEADADGVRPLPASSR